MQHTTAETSRKLRKAGYPQPALEAGQWWYVGESETPTLCDYESIDLWDGTHNKTYAPDALELLRALGSHRYSIRFSSSGQFVFCFMSKGRDYSLAVGPNPADLVAAEWLDKMATD